MDVWSNYAYGVVQLEALRKLCMQ